MPSSCKPTRQKSLQTQSKSAPQKGIAIATHSDMLQAYNPYKMCTGVGQTTYASKAETCIESIASLIYRNIYDMPSERFQYIVSHRHEENSYNAYYICISCVLSVHDLGNTYCRRINGVLAEFFGQADADLLRGLVF